ncbi:MAG: hypothetical protein HRT66_07855 [Flavobacteriaceae bacterium]|nr:hypothetical protein [Flavobacteriaceae bacterium]
MRGRPKNSEIEIIEEYRVFLDNAVSQPQIASVLAEFGYDADMIAQGKAIWEETNKVYLLNKTEDIETSEAYSDFSNRREQLSEIYEMHRKKAKVIFEDDNMSKVKLGVKGILPKAYVKWLQVVKMFYTEANANREIKNKLSTLKITEEDITNTIYIISDLEKLRNKYVIEKGESQNTTKLKDKAMIKLSDWMARFIAVAKIALSDNPQLLETLGKFVRS